MSILGIRENLVRLDSILALCAALLLLTFVTACGGDAPTGPRTAARRAATAATTVAERSDGEALYRGLFFGQGEVAQTIPELDDAFAWRSSIDEGQKAALDGFINDLTATIAKTNPDFYAAFEKEIESGDQVRIQAALDQAGDVTLAAMDKTPGVENWREQLEANRDAVQKELIRLYDEGKLTADEAETVRQQFDLLTAAGSDARAQMGRSSWSRGWALAIVVAVAVAVVYPPLIGVALAVVVAYAWAWSPKAARVENDVEKQQIVNAVAERLAAPATATATTAS